MSLYYRQVFKDALYVILNIIHYKLPDVINVLTFWPQVKVLILLIY